MTTSLARASRVPAALAPPLAALQFLTRIPAPNFPFTASTLPHAAAFFAAVGLGLGLLAALASHVLTPHMPRLVVAVLIVTFLVAVTGALHEDALADCADAFGLVRSRERTLAILHDSAIGSFGATALALALLARVALIASLSPERVAPTLIAALTLSRWAILPLTLLPAASSNGQASNLARRVPAAALAFGTVVAASVVAITLRGGAWLPGVAAVVVTALAAAFFFRRLGGLNGDCYGATVQLVEIAVLLCGVWRP